MKPCRENRTVLSPRLRGVSWLSTACLAALLTACHLALVQPKRAVAQELPNISSAAEPCDAPDSNRLIAQVQDPDAYTPDRLIERPAMADKPARFELSLPIEDYYDTAFVLTNGAEGKPRVINFHQLVDTLSQADVVFYGELHRHPGVHLQQARLLRALHERHPNIILSLEQFERDAQPVLDDYLAGRVGEDALIHRGRAWDNYEPSYRPLVSYAKDHGLPVIAAEAPTWAISCIGQIGPEVLTRFTPQERAWVAQDLHITPGTYRDRFLAFQHDSPSHGNKPSAEATARADRSYAAQVARDDTMAESIALALKAHPGSHVLHLNGDFHSSGFLGTVERLKLRAPNIKIAVISIVEVSDRLTPSFERSALGEGTVLQFVYPTPPTFAENEDTGDWAKRVFGQDKVKACKYANAQP